MSIKQVGANGCSLGRGNHPATPLLGCGLALVAKVAKCHEFAAPSADDPRSRIEDLMPWHFRKASSLAA